MNSSPSGAKKPSVNRIVLDASAILAVVIAEPGHERLHAELLSRAIASAVNVAEVHTKLLALGWQSHEAWNDATGVISEIVHFEEEHAKLTGDLAPGTRALGLSLGDRACLALGIVLGAPVYTAERLWRKLRLDVQIHVI
jgi:ribonuclease VapC